MGLTEMGTTQFRREADEGDRVRHAQGRLLYNSGYKYFWVKLGEMDGRRVQSSGALYQVQCVRKGMG